MALTMKSCFICEFSLMGVPVAWHQKLVILQETVAVTSLYMLKSEPNFTGLMTVPPWTHPCAKFLSKSERHLLAKGSVIFYAVMTPPTPSRLATPALKQSQKSHKTLMMLCCEACEFSCNGLSVAWRRNSMLCHETGSCFFTVHAPCTKFPLFDKRHALNMSPGQYSLILTVPPTGNRKWPCNIAAWYNNIKLEVVSNPT